MAGDRVRAGEYAERINAAADLADAGVPVAEAARVLAGRARGSQGEARRYAERAAQTGRVDAPQATTVFTVKLPGALAAAVREHARASGRTISAVLARAVEEFLARGRRDGIRLRPPRGHGFVSGLRHLGATAAGPYPGRPGRKAAP